VIVEILLAVADEDLHRGHFSLRGAARPAERYLAAFDSIRGLQADLERRARDAGVAVLYNEGADAVLRELMGIVLDAVDGLDDR
jgi:2-phosphoglycerate kinase